MLSLPRFGHFSGKENWLLENRPRLWERCWIFSSETAAAFLSSPEQRQSEAVKHAVAKLERDKRLKQPLFLFDLVLFEGAAQLDPLSSAGFGA